MIAKLPSAVLGKSQVSSTTFEIPRVIVESLRLSVFVLTSDISAVICIDVSNLHSCFKFAHEQKIVCKFQYLIKASTALLLKELKELFIKFVHYRRKIIILNCRISVLFTTGVTVSRVQLRGLLLETDKVQVNVSILCLHLLH